MSALRLPAPELTPESEPYWQGCRDGRLLLQRCVECRETYHYPRPFCPFCMSDRIEWFPASGSGVIYSFTVFRRGTPGLVPAFISLAEGPVIYSAILEQAVDKLAIGLPVKVTFAVTDTAPVPVFVLA
jgi:uncharacterized OB-fold protein